MRLFLLVTSYLLSLPAHALTFQDAIKLAEQNDTGYLASLEQLSIMSERVNQARAELLPQLSASASSSHNQRNYSYSNAPQNTLRDNYNSSAMQLHISQSIWQHDKLIAHNQAKISASQAEQQQQAARQDLYLRLLQAWFATLQSRDNVGLGKLNVQTYQRLMEQTQREYDLGVRPQTDLENARGRYEQAIAEWNANQSQHAMTIAELEQIIGSQSKLVLPELTASYTPPDLQHTDLEHWLKKSASSNPQILAAQQAVAVADEEVRKQRAGHEPTVDLIASYGKNRQGAGISGGQYGFDSKLASIGLQLNAPLYSGGGQSAKVREAMAQKNKAQLELESVTRQVQLRLKQAWFNQQSSRAQYQAALQNLKRSELQRKATLAEQEKGIKVELDVLQATLQQNTAQRDLNKARYELLLSYLSLKTHSGQLSHQDLIELDTLLVASAKDSQE